MNATIGNLKKTKTHIMPITFTIWREVALQNLMKDKQKKTVAEISLLKHEFCNQVDKGMLT